MRPAAWNSAWKNDAALLFVVLIWDVNFPVIKVPLEVMPPFAANVFRFGASVLFLGAFYAWQTGGQALFAPLRTHGKPIAWLGLLGHVAYQVCFITGVHWTTAGSAALIMAASPLWTAVASWLRGYERLPAAWGGLLVSLAGTVLVVAASANLSGGTLAGNLMMLAASVFWGAYTAFNTAVVEDVSPVGFAFLSILVALPALFALGVPYFGDVAWEAVGLVEWAALVFSGGFSTGVAYVIWAAAVKNVGASSTAAYANLVPFVALPGGALLLGETVTLSQVVGGVFIVGGLVALRRTRHRATPAGS